MDEPLLEGAERGGSKIGEPSPVRFRQQRDHRGDIDAKKTAVVFQASAGFGLYGAISGWVGAVCLILVVASFVGGVPGRAAAGVERQPLKPLIGFFASVGVYLILLNLIMFADQLLLKRLTAEWFTAHASDVVAALTASLIEAMFVLPSHMADFGKLAKAKGETSIPKTRLQRAGVRVTAFYERALRWSLHHRGTIVIAAYGLFFVMIVLVDEREQSNTVQRHQQQRHEIH